MVHYDFLDAIVSLIRHCSLCDLYKNGKALPYIGNEIKLVLLGEAPGHDEAIEGSPFVGSSGKYLFEVLDKYSIDRTQCLIVNTTQCRPIKKVNASIRNGKPTNEQILSCMAFVEAILFCCGCEHVLALGSYPKKWVAMYAGDKNLEKQPITSLIGMEYALQPKNSINKLCGDRITVTFSYHPAATLYDKHKKEVFDDIVRKFVDKLEVEQ